MFCLLNGNEGGVLFFGRRESKSGKRIHSFTMSIPNPDLLYRRFCDYIITSIYTWHKELIKKDLVFVNNKLSRKKFYHKMSDLASTHFDVIKTLLDSKIKNQATELFAVYRNLLGGRIACCFFNVMMENVEDILRFLSSFKFGDNSSKPRNLLKKTEGLQVSKEEYIDLVMIYADTLLYYKKFQILKDIEHAQKTCPHSINEIDL